MTTNAELISTRTQLDEVNKSEASAKAKLATAKVLKAVNVSQSLEVDQVVHNFLLLLLLLLHVQCPNLLLAYADFGYP
jgi:hypothetical protein